MQSCDRGYLDVAIAKKIVSETCKKRSQKYLVSESRGEPCACSSHVPIEGHTCCSTLLFKLTLSGSFTYYCVFMLPCVFIMQCILFSYLNSVIVINKHELIQVALLLHMTVHKRKNWPKFSVTGIPYSLVNGAYFTSGISERNTSGLSRHLHHDVLETRFRGSEGHLWGTSRRLL